MSFFTVLSNFNKGEVSPDTYLRDDIEAYFAGVTTATNVLSIPQGGMIRRPALQFFAILPGNSKLFPFEFNVDQVYAIAFSDLTASVYLNGVLIATVVTPFTEAQIFDATFPIDVKQQADTMVITHDLHQTRRIVRNVAGTGSIITDGFASINTSTLVTVTKVDHALGTGQTVIFSGVVAFNGLVAAELNDVAGHVITVVDSQTYTFNVTTAATGTGDGGGAAITFSALDHWSISLMPLKNIPVFDFEDSLTPTEVDEVAELTFTGTWAAGDEYRLFLEEFKTTLLKYTTDPQEQADRIEAALVALPSIADAIDIDVVNTSGGGTDPKGPYQITFQNGAANRDWALIVPKIGKNVGGGLILITDPSPVEGASGQEAVWSERRGWPRHITFHESRMMLGGTPFLPSTEWGSSSEDPFDFKEGTGQDSDALSANTTADRLDAIVHLVSLRNLVTLTSGAEFYSPEKPLTGRNVSFQRDTSRGVSPVRVVVVDGSIIFVSRNRTSIRQMIFTDDENAYVADDLTLLSRHMLFSPLDMDVEQGTQGDFVHVTQADGTMLVLNINRAENVQAWTRYTTRTGDKMVSIAALHDSIQQQRVWVSVERSINGVTVHYLERLSVGRLLDCSLVMTGSQKTNWTGFQHLAGETVTVSLDNGASIVTKTVSQTGTFTTEPADVIEVGFNSAIPILETLPPVANADFGRLALRNKRILRTRVDVVDSADVYVQYLGNEERLDPNHFGFDASPLISGGFEVRHLGWDSRPTVTITQKEPRPWAVRGIELEVEVHG